MQWLNSNMDWFLVALGAIFAVIIGNFNIRKLNKIAKKQNQKSGSHSSNIQVGRDFHVGLNYGQVRQVALDVFKANFYELSEKAKVCALERAEEITDKFLQSLINDEKRLIEKLESPGVQSSLFEVQKAYAKTGDQELGNRLLYILVERLKHDERSIDQIVMDEAINTLPKLTNNEVNLLTFKTCITEIRYPDNRSIEAFERFILDILLRFYPENISVTETSHLRYCGCFSLPTQSPSVYLSLGDYYGKLYSGLFTKGFTDQDFQTATGGIQITKYRDFIIDNLRFDNKYQFNSLTESNFENSIQQLNLEKNIESAFRKLWRDGVMSGLEVEKLLIEIDSRMKHVIYMYNRSILPGMLLTPVGYAIAIANYNQAMKISLNYRAFSDSLINI